MSSTPSQPEPAVPDQPVDTAAPGSSDDTAGTDNAVARTVRDAQPDVVDQQDVAAQPDVIHQQDVVAQPDADVQPDVAAQPVATGQPSARPVVAIPADGPLSDEQLAAIAATAQPATVRRAPRYKGFFWTGALVGIVLGVIFGLGLSYDGMVNRWIYVVVTVLGTALVTVLLAGALAALVDRRGAKRAAQQRKAATER